MKPNILTTVSQILFAFLSVAVSAFAQEPPGQTSLQYNRLSKQERDVILSKGTEPRFSGKYNDHRAEGSYICRRCNAPLFDSTHKFESSCGWPCFDDAIQDAVKRSINGIRPEILCNNCGGHLGHVFIGERLTPKNLRNCVNSVSLTFIAKGKDCPGVILDKEKGSREKSDANKNALLKLALDSAKANALRQGLEPSFEFLRNKLLEQLKDRDHDVVESALSSLEYENVHIELVEENRKHSYFETKAAIGIKLSVKERLIELLDSASVNPREKAARRLGELGPLAEDALPKLRELLANADSRTKLEVAEAVWRISGKAEESASVLVKLIREDEEYGRSTAWRFESMGPAAFAAFEAIEGLSKDPRDGVRETATRILGSFGPTHKLSTEAPLIARLVDTSTQVRIAASLALLKIDVALKEAIETLVEVVSKAAEDTPDPSKEKLHEELLIAAIDAIGLFEGEAVDAVLPISLHLNSRNLKIRKAVASALEKIGPGAEEVIPLLGKAMRDAESLGVPIVHYVCEPGDDAARALGSIGMAAVPILLDSLNDPEALVRIRAARELGRIQDATRQTVVPLIAKLSDSNAGVRLETIKSLGRLGKEANVAAPALTKFLFTTEALISFPSGGGIGITAPISPEALRTLRSIEASEDQIVPVILNALARNENLTLEAVAVLRQYPNRINEFEIPLRRILKKDGKNLGAACALAVLGANDSEIQVVLAKNLFEGEHVNSVAALGIGQLVAHGATLDESVFAQLSVFARMEYIPLSFWTILLRLTPDDKEAVASFIKAARDGGPFFDYEIDSEETQSALVARK